MPKRVQASHYDRCPECGGVKAKKNQRCASCRKLFRRHVEQPSDAAVRHIGLTQDQMCVVDTGDYDSLMREKWFAHKLHGRWYAYTARRGADGKPFQIAMHRVILGAPPDKQVDHIDGDSLNNRRSNLRLATSAQNARNRKLMATNTSGYVGVYWRKSCQKWEARICVDYKQISLGRFNRIENAATAYNIAAVMYHGEFARLNS